MSSQSILKVIFGCLTLLLPHAAHADWQYTRWGMSPSEVVKASNSKVEPEARSKDQPANIEFLKAPHEAQGVKFISLFIFEDSKLISVALNPIAKNGCVATKQLVDLTYGQGEKVTDKTREWRDAQNGIWVQFNNFDNIFCLLVYRAIPAAGAKGGL